MDASEGMRPKKHQAKHPRPNKLAPAAQTLEQRLIEAQSELDLWTKVAADPALSPAAASWARNVMRSVRAEVELLHKARLAAPPLERSGPPLP